MRETSRSRLRFSSSGTSPSPATTSVSAPITEPTQAPSTSCPGVQGGNFQVEGLGASRGIKILARLPRVLDEVKYMKFPCNCPSNY